MVERPRARACPRMISRTHGVARAGLWLLVVDDDRDARELMTEALGQRGAKVTGVASVTEAMTMLAMPQSAA